MLLLWPQVPFVVCSRLSHKLICTLCVMQGMYALFVSADEMYLCIDSYSSWITRSVSQHGVNPLFVLNSAMPSDCWRSNPHVQEVPFLARLVFETMQCTSCLLVPCLNCHFEVPVSCSSRYGGNMVCSALTYSLCVCRKLTSTTMVGMRLRRGYTAPAANAAEVDLGREETDDFAARVPVDKLVFVVHGIGQVTRALVPHHALISLLTIDLLPAKRRQRELLLFWEDPLCIRDAQTCISCLRASHGGNCHDCRRE